MAKGIRSGLAWAALGLGVASTAALGQVVEQERDTKLTGPRGRTIERDIKVERGPGFIDRQVEIKRPGETLIRDTRIQTFPGGRSFGPPRFVGPRYFGGPRFVENVFVPPPPVYGAFIGLPALSFAFGGGGGGFGGAAVAPPPPPGVVGGPPTVSQAPPQFDAFAEAIGRLKSFHGSSRRDGALTLGRIGDPRAVPALNERLEHDFDKEVRVAAAWALGEIGDEGGAVALERAAIHDHKHEVRDAATIAFKKLPRPGQAPTSTTGPVPPKSQVPYSSQPPTVIRSQPEVLDPGPNPNSNPSPSPNSNPPGRIYPEDTPPPPPVPATGPALEPPASTGPFRNPS